MFSVSSFSKILVLQWWKDSGYELKYDPASCIDSVIYRGRVDCLQWWKDSRLEWAADAEGRLAGTCIHVTDEAPPIYF
ncbi:hypothetical protein DFJ73DRAFT_772069 [Zopfochytrium polystomum]|nr:hypothetical protein DFJ73DRAFT_772069 [Zopfochytrium polystomum]